METVIVIAHFKDKGIYGESAAIPAIAVNGLRIISRRYDFTRLAIEIWNRYTVSFVIEDVFLSLSSFPAINHFANLASNHTEKPSDSFNLWNNRNYRSHVCDEFP